MTGLGYSSRHTVEELTVSIGGIRCGGWVFYSWKMLW